MREPAAGVSVIGSLDELPRLLANRPYEQRPIDFGAVAEAKQVARRRRRGGPEGEQE